MRRAQAFNAALIPRMSPAMIRQEADEIEAGLSDEMSPEAVAKLEEENVALIAERQRHAAEVLERRKGKAKPKRKIPKKARRF